MKKEKSQVKQEVDKATSQVLLRSTKITHQDQSGVEEGHKQSHKKSNFSKKQLQAAVTRVKNKELTTQQRKQALHVYMIMKNSNLCTANPTCRIGNSERTTFHGDDVDYQGYAHKYDEKFTDRGGTDE